MIGPKKTLLKDGKTVRWVARGVSTGKHPNGRRRQVTVTGKTRKEVEREIARITGQVAGGTYVPRWEAPSARCVTTTSGRRHSRRKPIPC